MYIYVYILNAYTYMYICIHTSAKKPIFNIHMYTYIHTFLAKKIPRPCQSPRVFLTKILKRQFAARCANTRSVELIFEKGFLWIPKNQMSAPHFEYSGSRKTCIFCQSRGSCCLACSVLQCVAVCCSVLQFVAVCCSVLQCIVSDF